MPTYQYACTACDERLEAVQSFTDAALTECPACHGRLRKVFSAVGVVFKGSGFYKNDSREAAASGTAKGKDGKDGKDGTDKAGDGGSPGAAKEGATKADAAAPGSGSGGTTGASSSGSDKAAAGASSGGGTQAATTSAAAGKPS